MGQSLKIAIYSGEIPSTTFIERLILGLAEKDHTIYLFGTKTKKVLYSKNVKVVGFTHNRVVKLFHLLKYSLLLTFFRRKDKHKLDEIIQQQSTNVLYTKVKYYSVLWHRPTIFHVQWAKGLEEWAWIQEFGMTLTLSLRGAHINYSPIANAELASMYQTYFPKVDGFHAVSNAIMKESLKYGASLEKIKVVYSGLDLDSFHTTTKQQTNSFEIISVGRSHWVKGYQYALDACRILKTFNIKFKYTIIGGANDLELLYQLDDLELQKHVILLDQIPFENVKTLVQSADLFLLPSVTEGVANVVLEAMALKTLVLSTDCGGMDETIQDGVNGFIVPIRDSKAIAKAIIDIHQLMPDERASIVENGFRTIKTQHSEAQMIDGMLKLYHFAITRNSLH